MSTHRLQPYPRFFIQAAVALAALLGLPASATAQHAAPASPQSRLPVAELSAGIHIIHAEVASTEDTRRIGLMQRQSLPDNNGMLFVFELPDLQCFWMRNTLLPLSIAFIADDGAIVNIADMAPQTDDAHCSARPVRYALEMAQGWFAAHGIKEGNRINGLP
ncbi:DUF192 domain-containing protein [Bordetella petrii]|uniref:DUF192 domain-containing protein n=1 Tax=Bordetella petrii TaxID=94624 RepID=UPI001A9658E0|nr:DUF192 domain-containing protein [Bordetella petrii]MBO1113081.1 DUF192 domain-containing protein [Bordetella petrii]